ncbi:MAG: hypothetical protein K2V38_17245 [Gemmataceae bacterium]|nr:hypothetical protein [Gemmataceae bacterium]
MVLPGQPVDVPLSPDLCLTFGYRGAARYVGFHWSPVGDQLVYLDGVDAGTGQSWAFLEYKRHRAVRPLLAPFDLGSSERDGAHVLLIDRQGHRASVTPAGKARAFLAGQHPPPPVLTPEQEETFRHELDRLLAAWRERPVDHEALEREMGEQGGRVARMVSWLDMAPLPPGPTP